MTDRQRAQVFGVAVGRGRADPVEPDSRLHVPVQRAVERVAHVAERLEAPFLVEIPSAELEAEEAQAAPLARRLLDSGGNPVLALASAVEEIADPVLDAALRVFDRLPRVRHQRHAHVAGILRRGGNAAELVVQGQ